MAIRYGVIGAFTIDNVINAEGEVAPRQCGGNAIYSAVGARLWSDRIGIVARVGEDYPTEWVRRLEDAGFDVAGVRPVPGPHRMQGGMLYDEAGTRRDFVPREYFAARGLALPAGMPEVFSRQSPETYRSAQMDFAPDPDDVPREYLTAAAFHLAPRFYVKHQGSLALLKNHGIPVTMDPGVWYMQERDEVKVSTLFKDVDMLLPSREEAVAFFGEGDLGAMARKLASYGPRVVAIKVGRAGSLVYDRQSDRLVQVPVYPARVKDPTGAGDSFCGGFMVGYFETGDPILAAMYGTVSASFIVEGFSALYALQFTRSDVEARLQTLTKMVKEDVPSW